MAPPRSSPLNSSTLPTLAERVRVPTYDRSAVDVGIVHLGVGSFHRAHQAMYLNRLMNQGRALDWGICGVGVLPVDRQMHQVMQAQDCLYTVVAKSADGSWAPEIIGSMVQYLFAPDDPEAVIERMSEPAVRIVSLTITEGGYNIDSRTARFDVKHPDVVADLVPGAVPRTVFGLVVEALRRRRDRGIPAFTVLSCDNLPDNGDVAKQAFSSFAGQLDSGLADWIARSVRFPNAMVDRISPATTDADRAELSERFGLQDGWPVFCEPFVQWVLEDDFGSGRPELERVGVQLVSEVAPYELMKLRLLNGGHQALGYLAYLGGHRLVHDAAQDPLFARFLADFMHLDALPTLAPVPGVDLERYMRELIERFGNPGVRDTLARLCTDGSDRIPKFVLPSIREQRARGGSVRHSATVIAGWAHFCAGRDENGEQIDVRDRMAQTLIARAKEPDPKSFLAIDEVFGNLIDDDVFVAEYRAALHSLRTVGVRLTLQRLAAGEGA